MKWRVVLFDVVTTVLTLYANMMTSKMFATIWINVAFLLYFFFIVFLFYCFIVLIVFYCIFLFQHVRIIIIIIKCTFI